MPRAKNATRIGARERQHDEPPYTHGARAKRGPRASHTHYQHTTSATRRPAREKHTAHTPNSNLNATACLQNAPSPDRGAGDGTAFSLTATKLRLPNGSVVVMTPCAVEITGGSRRQGPDAARAGATRPRRDDPPVRQGRPRAGQETRAAVCKSISDDLYAIDATPDASLNCGEAARSFRASYGW